MRVTVARQGYALDQFLNDKSEYICSLKVAKLGYELNILWFDDSEMVRIKVAKKDYYLDYLLVRDESHAVREAAEEFLKNNNITIEEYIENKVHYYNKSMVYHYDTS